MNSNEQALLKNSTSDFVPFDKKSVDDGNNQQYFHQYSDKKKHSRPYKKNWNRNFRRDQSNLNNGSNNVGGSSSPMGNNCQRFRYHQHFIKNPKFTSYKHNQRDETPIEQYFHQSMLEDPWTECCHFISAGSNDMKETVKQDTPNANDDNINSNNSI